MNIKRVNLKLFQFFSRFKFFIAFAPLFLCVFFFASYTSVPFVYAAESSAAQFLKLGFGARALGMGESFVAIADDISAIHYNPAGLAAYESEDREISISRQ